MSWTPGWDSITAAHTWSNVYFGASIVALIMLGVFEVFSHRYAERKDELSDTERSDTQRRHDEEMARLHLQTAALTADAEQSRAAIADATARAAEANRIAEGERLERVKLQAQLAGRHLTAEQMSRLHESIDSLKSQIPLIRFSRLGDKEAYEYATEFLRALDNTGIQIVISDAGSISPPQYGVVISPDLKAAFAAADIKVDRIVPDQPAFIFVALKIPAF